MKRGESLFTDASTIINGERQDMYGAPEDSFSLIAKLWSMYWQRQEENRFHAKDVAMFMMLYKIARQMNQNKRDNLVDIAGYLGILDDMEV